MSMTNNPKNIFLLGGNDTLSKHIYTCLKEDNLEIKIDSVFKTTKSYNFVIVNLFAPDSEIEKQIDIVLESKTQKIILLENALDIYLNSYNSLPYSVYSEVKPKNEICRKYLEIEKKICDSGKQFVIFRISEIYGVSMPESIIEDFLFLNTTREIEDSVHDFIYDGDVISAIEISLRKEVCGTFDIASGKTISLKQLYRFINKINNYDIKLKWKRKKFDLSFNCDNFKFYKWEPLIDIELGIKTLFNRRKHYDELRNSKHS